MTTVRVKTKSGHVQDLQFDEILLVDGRPWAAPESVQEQLQWLAGRISALEQIVGQNLVPLEESETTSIAS